MLLPSLWCLALLAQAAPAVPPPDQPSTSVQVDFQAVTLRQLTLYSADLSGRELRMSEGELTEIVSMTMGAPGSVGEAWALYVRQLAAFATPTRTPTATGSRGSAGDRCSSGSASATATSWRGSMASPSAAAACPGVGGTIVADVVSRGAPKQLTWRVRE